MQGTRIEIGDTWEEGRGPKPGDYWKRATGWMAACPNGLHANLERHSVTEHEDGTITVSPSILCRSGSAEWHGYLERGVWREC